MLIDERCVDCPATARRPAPYPGPRCFTHHHNKRKADRERRHDQRIASRYRGLAPGDYERIWEAQGRRCAVCWRRLTTAKKRPPLDHHHGQNWPRGILCQKCNAFIGWISDDPEAAKRLVEYLTNPPAWAVIGPPPEENT